MPNKDGVEACKEILSALLKTRVLVLTASTADQAIMSASAAGATDYLEKISGCSDLLSAVRDAAQGNSYAQVAEIIGNSPITVRNTIYRIEQKLGVTTKQEIVVWAVRHGLLDERSEAD